MKHPDGRSTVIPVHPGEELGRKMLMDIMNDVGVSKKEFLELLECYHIDRRDGKARQSRIISLAPWVRTGMQARMHA